MSREPSGCRLSAARFLRADQQQTTGVVYERCSVRRLPISPCNKKSGGQYNYYDAVLAFASHARFAELQSTPAEAAAKCHRNTTLRRGMVNRSGTCQTRLLARPVAVPRAVPCSGEPGCPRPRSWLQAEFPASARVPPARCSRPGWGNVCRIHVHRRRPPYASAAGQLGGRPIRMTIAAHT